MHTSKPSEPRHINPHRQLKSKSALGVQPVKHKSPATSAFLNRIKAIQLLRTEKESRRIESLSKQLAYQQMHSKSPDKEMLTLTPNKSHSKSPMPSNRISVKVLTSGALLTQETMNKEGKPTRHKGISQSLLYKLKQRVRRSPSVQELSKLFPSFKIEATENQQPTDNLMRSAIANSNAYSMEEAGYWFYNLTSHNQRLGVDDLQVKGRQTETHQAPIIKRNHLNMACRKVIDLDLTDINLSQEKIEESPACKLCKRQSNSAAFGIRNTIRDKKKLRGANPVDLVNIFGKASSLEGQDLLRLRFMEYKDFLWKVAYSFQFVLSPYERPKYYIGRGNNSKLLRQLMSKRWWWVKENDQNQATLVWTQLKLQEIYKNQPSAITADTIEQEAAPLETEADDNPAEDPARLILNPRLYEAWRRYLLKNLRKEKKATPELESRSLLTSKLKPIDSSSRARITNHLQFSRYVGNKKALFFTMRHYYQICGRHYSDCLPITYHITGGLQDGEYLSFLNSYHEKKRMEQQQSGSNVWIVKPGEMSNRGNGITVCNALSDIKRIICNKERHENGKLKTYILQEYICRPFLYNRRKFDIRHYILICSSNGLLKGYWYEEGYIRTTSYEYNLGRLDSSVHLTNDAVQKYCKDYGRFEKGNKVSYREFQQYLDGKYGPVKYNFEELVQTKIKEIATDVIRAAYCSIDPCRRLNNFEVFGLDFMIDCNFKPWLIQVNTNPCLELSSPLLARLIPAMVDNALRICLDPIYPPPTTNPIRKVPLETNRFQLVFDELIDGAQLDALYREQKGSPLSQLLNGVGSDDEAYEDQQQEDNPDEQQ